METWPLPGVLEIYQHAFANLFFMGAVEINTKIKNRLDKFDPVRWGVAESSWNHNGTTVLIRLFSQGETDGDFLERRALTLQCMIHEMVHALFRLYMCKGMCCNTDWALWNTYGLSGHGPCWVDVATTIETIARSFSFLAPIFNGYRDRLNIECSAIDFENEAGESLGFDPRCESQVFPPQGVERAKAAIANLSTSWDDDFDDDGDSDHVDCGIEEVRSRKLRTTIRNILPKSTTAMNPTTVTTTAAMSTLTAGVSTILTFRPILHRQSLIREANIFHSAVTDLHDTAV